MVDRCIPHPGNATGQQPVPTGVAFSTFFAVAVIFESLSFFWGSRVKIDGWSLF